jgi:uncharacterized membrane protein
MDFYQQQEYNLLRYVYIMYLECSHMSSSVGMLA